MLRAVLATAAVVAFAGAASADCYSGHTAKKESTLTTAQISTPVAKPETKQN